jgi:hypothetical protein
MYYSTLGRIKKEPKFSMGKLKRIQKKFGAEWRSHVPASWNAIIERMAAEYAAATGNRPFYGAGASGEVGAPGDTFKSTVPIGTSTIFDCINPTACTLVPLPYRMCVTQPCYAETLKRTGSKQRAVEECKAGKPTIVDKPYAPPGTAGTLTCNPMLPVNAYWYSRDREGKPVTIPYWTTEGVPFSLNGLGDMPLITNNVVKFGLPILAGLVGMKVSRSALVGAAIGAAAYYVANRR